MEFRFVLAFLLLAFLLAAALHLFLLLHEKLGKVSQQRHPSEASCNVENPRQQGPCSLFRSIAHGRFPRGVFPGAPSVPSSRMINTRLVSFTSRLSRTILSLLSIAEAMPEWFNSRIK